MKSTANLPEACENVVSFAAVIRVVTPCVTSQAIFPYPSPTLHAVPSTFRFKTQFTFHAFLGEKETQVHAQT